MSLNPGDDESRIDRLHRLLDELHERTPRRELALQMLKKSLKANPPFEEPKTLLPVEEAEIRRDFAIKLEAEIRTNPLLAHFRLNAMQVATILSVPISTLRPGGYLSLRDSGGQQNSEETLFQRLEGIRLLVRHFLRPNQGKELLNNTLSELFSTPRSLRTPRNKRTQSPASLPSSKKSKRSSKTRQKCDDPDAEYLPKEEGRDKDERDKCFERDGKACVLMRTVDPHVCHIIPFSWNNKELNIRKTGLVFGHAEAFLGQDWRRKYQTYLQNPVCPGGSDKAWNMICLDMQMQTWWSKARFGLKCLGLRTTTKDESVVTLQFNWMPQSAMKPTDQMTLQGRDNDFDRMVKSARAFYEGGSFPSPQEFGTMAALSAASASAAPILSGDLVEVKMLSSETHLFKAMIEFQWAMIVVAAFSGAGEPELLLGDGDGDSDSDQPDLRTMKWVEDQQSQQATC
ncbi:uncharacterized protein NECHADRAFT_76718 [Fusarium vanettenii 77-13-4]|uniref:Uncharacterized protein n=1 Tax=Fusarium vanettenii (strain ATCC MYA-4622 / CBS 123669 / FGSC 9596 / NRRL 45880 / 77-13-4) TaxID=660122 RepID=C7Z520_FUSV7|nr:uncharacterized protein NECHADRAFT_76718 [Fusarium vanettenii 77-13-4]EEU40443.1 hypothetical protein NECHADRAFT_76718 [Fusarium vanettenii 77-13-4]